MATISLTATNREASGKGAARKVRRAGFIPAVIYREGQPATSITIDPDELELNFQRTRDPNTLVDIGIEKGESWTCLVRAVQRHPVSGVLRHVDFFQVNDEEEVVVAVPIVPEGVAAGTKLGGTLQLIQRKINVRCLPKAIPSAIPVDVSNLNVNDFIRASQIQPPKGGVLIFSGDFNVVTVVGQRKMEEVVEEMEEAAEESVAQEDGEG